LSFDRSMSSAQRKLTITIGFPSRPPFGANGPRAKRVQPQVLQVQRALPLAQRVLPQADRTELIAERRPARPTEHRRSCRRVKQNGEP